VVSSSRTSNGRFVSSKKNILLNVVDITGESAPTEVIFNFFYKNRLNSTYSEGSKVLSMILGKENFRTFKVTGIDNLTEILVNND
jgi:hypothetical protein